MTIRDRGFFDRRYDGLAKALLAGFLLLLVAACASQNAGPGPRGANNDRDPATAAQQAADRGDYARAADLYARAAGQAANSEAQRSYRFEAGLAAAQAGDAEGARQMLASIDPSQLDAIAHARYNLAQREIAIAGLSPGKALANLPPPAENTAPAVAERVWDKRAQLQFKANRPVDGLAALVQRGAWLERRSAVEANDERIYERAKDAVGLGIGPDSPDADDAPTAVRGWLALADIGQRAFAGRAERDEALANWQQTYPGHPANRFVLGERFDYQSTMAVTAVERGGLATGTMAGAGARAPSDQVALALPMSGSFKNAAGAIRDGFTFAYRNNSGGLPSPISYDTSNLNAQALAGRAESDDIGVLVGPLDKDKVAAMARQQTAMPVIGLNTIEETVRRSGFYQFGLDPADEAASAARHAMDRGDRNAIALVPQGEWGDRVLDGFRDALNADGGQLVDYRTYDSATHDHSQAIQAVLGRGNQANADFIFVAGQPTQARLIRSQLKFYKAGDLPMVTTSHAYSGQVDTDSDIDLNGVYFVDMPWLLGEGGTISRLRQEAEATYGRSATDYARLFAMGMDAWVLARNVAKNKLSANQPLEGMTGVLAPRDNGHIARYLGWAVFRNGRPQTLSLPATADVRASTSRANTGPRPGSSSYQNDRAPTEGGMRSSMDSL